jgi:hypothetical protein
MESSEVTFSILYENTSSGMSSWTCRVARCSGPRAQACGDAMFHGALIRLNYISDISHEDCTLGQPSVLEPRLQLLMSYKRRIMLRYLDRVINVFKLSTKPTQPSDFLGLPAELRVKIYTDIILAASRCTFQEPGHGSLFWVKNSDSLDLYSSLDPAHAAVRRYEHVPGLHPLRLTCHCIRDELDHEIVRRVVLQVNDLLRDLNNPVGRLHGISLHTSWIDRSLSRTISKPRAFKDVQNLRIFGRLQGIYNLLCPGTYRTEEIFSKAWLPTFGA